MKSRLFRANSLYSQTARMFLVTLLLVQSATLAVTGYLVFLPVFRSSVNDLAALMVLSAKTYVELPPRTRPDFVQELKQRQQLDIRLTHGPMRGTRSFLPYVVKLEEALGDDLFQDISIQASSTTPRVYWVDIHLADEWLRLSFPRQRIGTHPPLTLFLLILSSLAITVAATLLVSRRLSAPLVAMAQAIRQVSHGALPPPLAESGPSELATLARGFNRMALRVRELLDTRTTLLAGISHDLRTPMARIRLQVELMRGQADEKRLTDIERDLEEMQQLISQLLDIAREVSTNPVEPQALRPLVQAVVAAFERSGAEVRTELEEECAHPVNALAFKRIVSNFLDNALKHGRPPVSVRLVCDRRHIRLEVHDHGDALAHDNSRLFQPFVQHQASSGSGLGLAIVRGIAQAYEWEVRLGGTPGQGTLAELILPRTD